MEIDFTMHSSSASYCKFSKCFVAAGLLVDS